MGILVLGSYVQATCLCVAQLPRPGESLAASALEMEHGGKGFNLAIGIHRLGVPVAIALAVGTDAAGDELSRFLCEEGIDDRYVVRLGDHSGFGVGFIAPNGENFLAVYPGTNALLRAAHLSGALESLRREDWIYAQFEIDEEPILASFRYARDQGARTVLNPSPWHIPDPALLKVTDILVVNGSEAALLLGLDSGAVRSPQLWLSLLSEWVARSGWQGELIVATLGAEGCVAVSRDNPPLYQPAYPITPVDATGAGDAFSAGLMAGLASGMPLTDALRWANACGAWVASRMGVLRALPRAMEVDDFINTIQIPK
jgi:ribokinase